MPQLDVTTYLPQLFWLGVTFVALYILMARRALPRVAEVLEERQNRIDADLEQAENYRKESEKLEESYEKLTAEAKAKALSHLQSERQKIEARIAEKQAKMNADLEARLKTAETGIEKAKGQAFESVEDIAAEACSLIVAKVSGAKMAKTAARKAVQQRLGVKS